ncbi:TPR repeat protein [Rhodopirellula islandica]|uniref:TPR repeat protein n=1 Tax=Rhodopirellula islandica TaxID=595434 RepID=A0A0J1BEG0_RHOIS|nr:tetratricopeptide repeat protein [Rhodopirellula islandica]KLU04958.1 TPR repeat protein [Rhodopirellula islandica]
MIHTLEADTTILPNIILRFPAMHRSILLTLALSLALGSVPRVAANDDALVPDNVARQAHPATADVQKAAAAFAQGKHEEALQQFIEIHNRHPDLSPGELLFAQIAFQAKQVGVAKVALEKAAVTQADDPETWNMLAALALADGRLAETEMLFQRGLTAAEQYTANDQRKTAQAIQAHAGLATVYEKRSQWNSAKENLRDWISLDPRDTKPWPRLAVAFFKLGQESTARETLQNLRSFSPNADPVDVAMGKLYQSVGRRQDATDAMQTALETDRENLIAQVEIARYAMDAGEQDLMRRAIDQAVSLDGDQPAVRYLQGMAARFDRDSVSAVDIFSQLHREDPSNFEASNGLILSLLSSEESDQHPLALKHAEVLYQSNTNVKTGRGRVAASSYAWALLKNNDLANAEAVMTSVVKTRVLSAEIGYFAAEIFAAVGKQDLSRTVLKATLASPQSFVDRPAAERLMSRLDS